MRVEDISWFDIDTSKTNFGLLKIQFHLRTNSPLLAALGWPVGVISHILWTTYIGTLIIFYEGTTFDMA